MVKKEELCETIEELLGVELESLRNMKKEDLEKLVSILCDPKNLVQVLRRSARKRVLDRTVRDILEKPLKELIDVKGEGGLLGLGLLPKLLTEEE